MRKQGSGVARAKGRREGGSGGACTGLKAYYCVRCGGGQASDARTGAIIGGSGMGGKKVAHTSAGLETRKNKPGPRRIVPSSIYSKYFKKKLELNRSKGVLPLL
jgi:hypothetical protein